jgi:broad specificity phosphatase PhoE
MSAHTLILVRHAHRDVTDRLLDNGLSAKGRKQAEAFKVHFESHYAAQGPWRLLSSPRLRCRETVGVLGKIEILRALDEQGDESHAAFIERIDVFMRGLKDPRTVACSHGDWIPIAVERLFKMKFDLRKGGMAEIIWDDRGHPTLRKVIQDWPGL